MRLRDARTVPGDAKMTYERTVWVELPVRVTFNYQPFEPAETGPEAQYPGCAEAIEIAGCFIDKTEITAQLTDDECSRIEGYLWEQIREEREGI